MNQDVFGHYAAMNPASDCTMLRRHLGGVVWCRFDQHRRELLNTQIHITPPKVYAAMLLVAAVRTYLK